MKYKNNKELLSEILKLKKERDELILQLDKYERGSIIFDINDDTHMFNKSNITMTSKKIIINLGKNSKLTLNQLVIEDSLSSSPTKEFLIDDMIETDKE